MITPTFAQSSENSFSWLLRHAICHQTPIHTSPQSHNRGQGAVKQLIRCLRNTQHSCLEPRGIVQKRLLKLVGRSGSDRTSDSTTRHNVTRYHCNVQERDDVQPKSEADSNQFQFMRKRVVLSQCLRKKTSGTRTTLQGTVIQSFSSFRDGFISSTTHSTAQRTSPTVETRCWTI